MRVFFKRSAKMYNILCWQLGSSSQNERHLLSFSCFWSEFWQEKKKPLCTPSSLEVKHQGLWKYYGRGRKSQERWLTHTYYCLILNTVVVFWSCQETDASVWFSTVCMCVCFLEMHAILLLIGTQGRKGTKLELSFLHLKGVDFLMFKTKKFVDTWPSHPPLLSGFLSPFFL